MQFFALERGEKDFQQLRVVETLVADLGFNIQIVRAPLVREPDGLALSSRNVGLSASGRASALTLSRALFAAAQSYESGAREAAKILQPAKNILMTAPEIQIEYLELVEEAELHPIEMVSKAPARILLTAYVDGIRLLDNISVG